MPLGAPGTDMYNWYHGQCPGVCAERKSNSKAQDYSWAFGFSTVSNKAGYSELRKGRCVSQYSPQIREKRAAERNDESELFLSDIDAFVAKIVSAEVISVLIKKALYSSR